MTIKKLPPPDEIQREIKTLREELSCLRKLLRAAREAEKLQAIRSRPKIRQNWR